LQNARPVLMGFTNRFFVASTSISVTYTQTQRMRAC
jgi:hypothetical protein